MINMINNEVDLKQFISESGVSTPELIDKLIERQVIISEKMAKIITKITNKAA